MNPDDPLLKLWLITREAETPLDYLRAMQDYYLFVDVLSWDGRMCREAADELAVMKGDTLPSEETDEHTGENTGNCQGTRGRH